MSIYFSVELYLEMAVIWSYPAVDKIKWEILEGKVFAKKLIFSHNIVHSPILTNFEAICIGNTWKNDERIFRWSNVGKEGVWMYKIGPLDLLEWIEATPPKLLGQPEILGKNW